MNILIQKQEHLATINQVTSRTPLWRQGDAMITREKYLALVAYGADCSIIAFWKDDEIGICHAGWRGYSLGLVKKMAEHFSGGECYVGPFLHKFEVKEKDYFMHFLQRNNHGLEFVKSDDNGFLQFHFKEAILNDLNTHGLNAGIDDRSTFDFPELASWRRDRLRGEGIQNRLVVWHSRLQVCHRLFGPGENVREYFGIPAPKDEVMV